jgi:hypothetical protein
MVEHTVDLMLSERGALMAMARLFSPNYYTYMQVWIRNAGLGSS